MSKPIVHAQLRAFVERIERLHSERDELAADLKDIYAEVRGNGYDTKVLKAVIARRRKDADEVAEMDEMMQIYLAALDGLDKSSDTGHARARIAREVAA